MEALLADMQLMVVPLTGKLLHTPSGAMAFEIRYATEHHIPLLPLPGETLLKPAFCAAVGMPLQAEDPFPALYRWDPLDPDKYPLGTPEEDVANGDFCFLTGQFRQAVDYYVHAMIRMDELYRQDEKRYEAQFETVIRRTQEMELHFHLSK